MRKVSGLIAELGIFPSYIYIFFHICDKTKLFSQSKLHVFLVRMNECEMCVCMYTCGYPINCQSMKPLTREDTAHIKGDFCHKKTTTKSLAIWATHLSTDVMATNERKESSILQPIFLRT